MRDNDRAYGQVFTDRLAAMGIRDRPISPGSPWQNGIAERLIGTLRRECLDHVVVFGEKHLRRVLSAYAIYYNQTRPHRSLQKDAPICRAAQRIGTIAAIPVLGWDSIINTSGYDFRKGQAQRGASGTVEIIPLVPVDDLAAGRDPHLLARGDVS